MTRLAVWRELRSFAPLAIPIALYAIVRVIFGVVAGDSGVFAGTSIHGTAAALGLATLALRFVVLVIVPIVAIYRLVMRLARAAIRPPP